ncbi:MAG: hypothetical protein WC440_06735 [Candidatus Omnitrophota bacterium]
MNKEEALTTFLKGLRVAINNALAYSRQHPYFLKSTQEFKEKIDALLVFLDPIKVSATTNSLFLDGKYWDKVFASAELAQILHQRKIKSIEFKSGLAVPELADCLSFLALQPKEILKKGGLSRLLKEMNSQHIRIEELDYSGLLGSQGEATKDVWLYLFNDAVEKHDAGKINEFANNFSEGVKNLSIKKVIEDNKLRENLHELLRYLKDEDKEKFLKCSQDLSGLFLNSGAQINAESIEKLKGVFSELDGNDFADLLLSQVSDTNRLNTLNLQLFSRLAGEEKADKIAFRLADKVKDKTELSNKPVLYKKIKDLLSGPDAQTVSPAYHSALSTLIKDISFKDTLFFDREQLHSNYRAIILNLFTQERNIEDLRMILEKLDKEWANIIQDKDYQSLKYLLEALKQKSKNGELPVGSLEDLEKRIGETVENSIWDEVVPEGLALLAEALDKSYATADLYLDKIFRENRLNTHGLKLFLRFFPEKLDIFYEQLRLRRTDLEFLSQAIRILFEINLPVSAAVLKEVFFSGNELIKLEVLKSMGSSGGVDAGFLFPLLGEKSIALRKEALRILRKNDADKKKALELLLGIPSPWGSKNQLILENIKIVEDLWLKEATDYLIAFSRRRFFWNRSLRVKALEVLKKWK